MPPNLEATAPNVTNDFAIAVKPAFEFLTRDRGYLLVHEEEQSSFDSGSLIYESPLLHIEITRDRGQVWFRVRARGDYRDLDDEIIRLLLAGGPTYVPGNRDLSVEASAALLRERLPDIERLFRPDMVATTMRQGTSLKEDRAKVLFGAA